MIKRLLAIDGVNVVCKFRDDGAMVEAYGMLSDEHLVRLAKFGHDYKRLVQGNADQLSMFTQMPGWTPPRGWILRGAANTVCSVGNLVCLVDSAEGSINEVMRELEDASRM